MKLLKIASLLILSLVVVLIMLAPIGPLPGILIGGTETPVPDAWDDTSDIHEIKFEVSGTLPRVVTIWVVQVDGDMHVVGSKESGWVSILGQGGPVRMKLEGKTYPMMASTVSDNFPQVLEAYQNKYRADYPDIVNGFPPLEEARATVAVYRLAAR